MTPGDWWKRRPLPHTQPSLVPSQVLHMVPEYHHPTPNTTRGLSSSPAKEQLKASQWLGPQLPQDRRGSAFSPCLFPNPLVTPGHVQPGPLLLSHSHWWGVGGISLHNFALPRKPKESGKLRCSHPQSSGSCWWWRILTFALSGRGPGPNSLEETHFWWPLEAGGGAARGWGSFPYPHSVSLPFGHWGWQCGVHGPHKCRTLSSGLGCLEDSSDPNRKTGRFFWGVTQQCWG